MDKKTLGIVGVILVVVLIGLFASGTFNKGADDQSAAAGKGKKNTAVVACNDGIDNDGDGLIDYPADPGCQSPTGTSEVDIVSNAYPDADLQVSVDASKCSYNYFHFQEPAGGQKYSVAWKKPTDTNWTYYNSQVSDSPILVLLGNSQIGGSTNYEGQIYITYADGYGKSTIFNFTSAAVCQGGTVK